MISGTFESAHVSAETNGSRILKNCVWMLSRRGIQRMGSCRMVGVVVGAGQKIYILVNSIIEFAHTSLRPYAQQLLRTSLLFLCIVYLIHEINTENVRIVANRGWRQVS
jgi:hypothetical protein